MEGFANHPRRKWFRIPETGNSRRVSHGPTDYLRWWNSTRIQQRLGRLSPGKYRAQTSAIAQGPIPTFGVQSICSLQLLHRAKRKGDAAPDVMDARMTKSVAMQWVRGYLYHRDDERWEHSDAAARMHGYDDCPVHGIASLP